MPKSLGRGMRASARLQLIGETNGEGTIMKTWVKCRRILAVLIVLAMVMQTSGVSSVASGPAPTGQDVEAKRPTEAGGADC